MSKLPSAANALIDAGRQALQPTPADRERILASLQARLGADAGAGAGSPVAAPAAAGGIGWPTLALVAVGLAIGGGLALQSLKDERTQAPILATAAPPAPATAVASAEPTPAPPTTAESVAAPAPPSTQTPTLTPRGPGRLAEEVAILSRAQTDLHAGHFASALRLLEEHARKFPRGALAQERVAARIQALCGAGRHTEANAELERLSPGSLHERRARVACATKPKLK